MADYQKMYTTMFNAATDALRALETGNPDVAAAFLMMGQIDAEEIYLNTTPNLIEFPPRT